MRSAPFDSFGRILRHDRVAVAAEQIIEDLRSGGVATPDLLAFGLGRSYGDSCHNDQGWLVPMQARKKIIGFDPDTGILEAEAGLTLDETIRLAASSGHFLPVTPGTRFVTLGGAVANDVHGKNHHRRGTFGCHVESLDLLRSDGTLYRCSNTENTALFEATIGGLGLTGLILSVRLKLMRVGSLDIEQKIIPFETLDHYFDLAEAADAENEYAVSWVDQLATGKSFGRGVLIVGNHADNGNFEIKSDASRLRVPFDLPFSVLNRPSLRLFNSTYFHAKRSKTALELTDFRSFFYPLDGVGDWNRLYGQKGLFQHQCVIPFETARDVVPAMLQTSRASGHSSFLTVLKRFGDVPSPGLMSFPQPGYTLTMDFPNSGMTTLALLDRLDAMTVDAGGRINPYKDQRMSADVFRKTYPNWLELEAIRDKRFCSDFWRRAALSGSDVVAHAATKTN